MAGTTQSRGTCAFCGHETTKGAMKKHFEKCPGRAEAAVIAEASTRKAETMLVLRVEDAYSKEFWFDIEMRGEAKLSALDNYLRYIWLECCGHLSEFSADGWGSRKVGKAQTASKAFELAPKLTHIYDFGTSSETNVSLVGTREGKALTKHPITLLARNVIPKPPCQKCEEVATHLCMECVIEEDAPGLLCATHVKRHPHKNYGKPMPLVNSPRLGMCGYDGPAKPPY